MADLLVELFSEEIPARMQGKAAADLAKLLGDGLTSANLTYGNVEAYSTPRRLTVAIDGLPTNQPDRTEERKGPKVGAPQQAIDGFLKGAGLSSIDQCEQRETPKGAVWFAVSHIKGQATAEVLPTVIADAIKALGWPKSMRFADYAFRWVRPLKSVLAIFDGAVLEGGIDLNPGMLAFSGETAGHRFLSEGSFTVSSFDQYRSELAARHVILSPSDRRDRIAEQLADVAAAEGLQVVDDPGLLNEVAGLVEWPVSYVGKIDPDFMEVPREVLTTSMRAHQKYFALNTADGAMAPNFAVVANMVAADGGAAIVAGNERVLRARLADAKFFWDQDRATDLEDRLESLSQIVFHAKLGSVADRVDRVAALAEALAHHIDGCDPDLARRAAQLCKADLVTGMVGEFPELQGIMGRYYAIDQEEDGEVADAIAHHYSPAGPNDACPTQPVSIAVALADKLDILAGFWLIDEKPTGSKDPFALRRAALGIIRLTLENQVRLPLGHFIAETFGLYGEQGLVDVELKDAADTALDLLGFIADRMKVHLRDEGISHDLISALFALGDEDDLVRLVVRVHALNDFLSSDDGGNLLIAYRRAANILRIEEKKDDQVYGDAPDPSLFDLDAEKQLFDALEKVGVETIAQREAEDFKSAMTTLAALRVPVDAFFEHVTVNAEDAGQRKNRLCLLSNIRNTMATVADFSKIEGDHQ